MSGLRQGCVGNAGTEVEGEITGLDIFGDANERVRIHNNLVVGENKSKKVFPR